METPHFARMEYQRFLAEQQQSGYCDEEEDDFYFESEEDKQLYNNSIARHSQALCAHFQQQEQFNQRAFGELTLLRAEESQFRKALLKRTPKLKTDCFAVQAEHETQVAPDAFAPSNIVSRFPSMTVPRRTRGSFSTVGSLVESMAKVDLEDVIWPGIINPNNLCYQSTCWQMLASCKPSFYEQLSGFTGPISTALLRILNNLRKPSPRPRNVDGECLIKTFLAEGMHHMFDGTEQQAPTELLGWLLNKILAEMAQQTLSSLPETEKRKYNKRLENMQSTLALEWKKEFIVGKLKFKIKTGNLDPTVVGELFGDFASAEDHEGLEEKLDAAINNIPLDEKIDLVSEQFTPPINKFRFSIQNSLLAKRVGAHGVRKPRPTFFFN